MKRCGVSFAFWPVANVPKGQPATSRYTWPSLMGPSKLKLGGLILTNIIKTDDEHTQYIDLVSWLQPAWDGVFTIYNLVNQWTPTVTPHELRQIVKDWLNLTFPDSGDSKSQPPVCTSPIQSGLDCHHITPYLHMLYDHIPTMQWLPHLKSRSTCNLERLQNSMTTIYFQTTDRKHATVHKTLMLTTYRRKFNTHTNELKLEKKHHCPECGRSYVWKGGLKRHTLAVHTEDLTTL